MHTCKPPSASLNAWLVSYPSTKGKYGHLLLEQKGDNETTAKAFRPYFESAHLDAREHFHSQMGIDLHPDAYSDEVHAAYPTCLPTTARRGLFGEVMAGMLTEHFTPEYVGKHEWKVPIFLFRYHADVEAYLFTLVRDPSRRREVYGRFGSDFIGLAFTQDGDIARFISGEAKWRKVLSQAIVDDLMLGKFVNNDKGNRVRSGKGIWGEVNRNVGLPHGLRQLQKLLEERDPEKFAAAILSMDKALMLRSKTSIPRTNLIFLSGNDFDKREASHPLIPWEEMPSEYTAPHDLQVVELILHEGEVLIDAIYDQLWEEKND